jgi:hypothetical protein
MKLLYFSEKNPVTLLDELSHTFCCVSLPVFTISEKEIISRSTKRKKAL